MASREFLWLVQEVSYGTPATPTTGTNAFYIRLDGSNAFTMATNPTQQTIMYGGGRNTPAIIVADQFETRGQLKTKLYAGAISKFLADWGLTVIATGRSAPWTTTDSASVMPVGDLASVSCYHAKQLNDGSYERRRYAGCKVVSGSISCNRQSQIAELTLDLVGVRDDLNGAGSSAFPDATEFPAPAETDYSVSPYLFSHTSTLLKIAATITQYDSVTLSWNNSLSTQWFEAKYPVLSRFTGRSSTLSADLHLKVSPDKRAAYQALTAQDSELSFNNGSNSLKFDLNTKNVITALPWDLPIDQVFKQKITVQNLWDSSIPGDIVVSST